MIAVQSNFLTFLQQPKQFVVPIYQRLYSWEVPQCQQLWNDIVKVAKDDSANGHFIGSVVYIAKGIYHSSSVPQLLLIDGQQRITTLTLLLSAFSKVLEEQSADIGIRRRQIQNYYLFNSEEIDEMRYKLMLTRSDKETLTRILNDKEEDEFENPARRLLANHQFFLDQLRKPSTDLEQIYQGIRKLIIVDISLDRDHDNPQLIFESLNATGLKLSQADLIRNYVLMGLDPQTQTRVYEDYWHPMERAFGQTSYVEWFDSFMRDYLTLKMGNIPNIREVYTTFKGYAQSQASPATLPEIVADIAENAANYVRFVLAKETDPDLLEAFSRINVLRLNVAFPFFLELYRDFRQGVLTKSGLVVILELVESYVFRRAVCNVPTNNLNKIFAALSREIDKNDYLESFKAVLVAKTSFRRFPADDEFHAGLLVKDFYNFRNRVYLLERLENHKRNELVSVAEYTIEHIMPQNKNLSLEWQASLGERWQEVQAKYLHTLGNLTLTGYNSEYGDRPFAKKRDMTGGFATSPLLLNQGLGQLPDWNEETIRARAETLAAKALTIWKYPEVSPATIAKYQPPAYSIVEEDEDFPEDASELIDEILASFLPTTLRQPNESDDD